MSSFLGGGGSGSGGITDPYITETGAGGTKLHAIVPGVPTAVTDQVVGVIGGTTDALFSLIELHDLVNAASDLDFYVATTGSDSNPGTIGSPFLTIQHALNVASAYNYGGMFFPTIHVADGTYTTTETNLLRFLTGVAGNGEINCNNGVLGNVIIDNTASGFTLFQTEANANWTFTGGFHGKSANAIFRPDNFGSINLNDDMIIDDPSNSGLMYLANVQHGGGFGSFGNTITILATTFGGILQVQSRSSGNLLNGTVVLPTNWVSTNGLYFLTEYSSGLVRFNTYSGGPISSSAGSAIGQFCQWQTETGQPSDIPDGLFYDATCIIDGGTGGRQGSKFYVVGPSEGPHGVPAVANFRDLAWQIYKDDTADPGAGVYVAGTDSGKLFLVGEGLPYNLVAPLTGDTVSIVVSPTKTTILNPAGVLATLTVEITDNQPDGFVTRISTTQTITAITFATIDGSSIVGAPTTLAASSSVQFIYNLSGNTWYPG